MNSRTSCRKAASSGVSRRSTERSYAPDAPGSSFTHVVQPLRRSHKCLGLQARPIAVTLRGAFPTWVQQGEHILRGTTRAAASLAAIVTFALAVVGSALAGDITGHGQRDKLASADVNATPAAQRVLDKRAAQLSTNPPAATAALKDSLGLEGVVKLDALTGTARYVGSTNGFLTGASGASADS